MTVMRKLTLLLLCLALGIGVCDAKKKNRGVYFRTDAEIVLDKPYFGLNVSNMIQVVLEADRNPASVRVETENGLLRRFPCGCGAVNSCSRATPEPCRPRERTICPSG